MSSDRRNGTRKIFDLIGRFFYIVGVNLTLFQTHPATLETSTVAIRQSKEEQCVMFDLPGLTCKTFVRYNWKVAAILAKENGVGLCKATHWLGLLNLQ